jgi:sulfite reductase alpha subunit-like flavoprotein
MLGQALAGKSVGNEAGARMFRYEVQGIAQNDRTDRQSYPVRHSGSVFINVPYSRMNQEMQRILRLGGKIVSITPIGADDSDSE